MSKKTLTSLFIGLIIGSVSLAYADWAPPTATPPNGNTPAPINVGTLPQDKDGVLTLGGLGVFGSALITPTGGYTLPSTLNLGVNGKIGAKQYCDEKGMNCVTTLGGVGSGGVSLSGGQSIVCGGWDVKYGSSGALNTWGCAGSDSSPACPSGYDTIKSSKVTINLAEQTNLCILHSAGGGSSNSQIFPGWPNSIVCNATTGRKYVLPVTGYFPKGQERYSDKPGYIYGDIGGLISIFFDGATKKSLKVHGNGDYMNGGKIPQEYAPCFDLNKSISDSAFTWH